MRPPLLEAEDAAAGGAVLFLLDIALQDEAPSTVFQRQVGVAEYLSVAGDLLLTQGPIKCQEFRQNKQGASGQSSWRPVAALSYVESKSKDKQGSRWIRGQTSQSGVTLRTSADQMRW